MAVLWAGRGVPRKRIRRDIEERFEYDLSISVDELGETYQYNETCQQTVPEAIRCFLEADGFEDAIRNAISIGGDSDTLAAITGRIAEAKWGVPEANEREVLKRLDGYLFDTCQRYISKVAKQI